MAVVIAAENTKCRGLTIYMSKKGNVIIEATITFSITILFITYIINAIVLYRTDVLMQKAVTKTCNDFSIITPLTVPASDIISTAVNAAPESVAQAFSKPLQNALSVMMGFDIVSGNYLTSSFLDATLSRSFANDIYTEFIRFNDGSDFMAPDKIDVEFRVDSRSSIIYVTVGYQVKGINGITDRRIVSGIPFYGDMEFFLNANKEDSGDNSIWKLSNFERGKRFIEMYGGNMPSTFPVIDGWDGSTATAITSINTLSLTYSSMDNFDKRIIKDIDDLSSFNGANVNINGNNYVVNGKDIQQKVLVVIIPENSQDSYISRLQGLSEYARSQNITLKAEQYGQG